MILLIICLVHLYAVSHKGIKHNPAKKLAETTNIALFSYGLDQHRRAASLMILVGPDHCWVVNHFRQATVNNYFSPNLKRNFPFFTIMLLCKIFGITTAMINCLYSLNDKLSLAEEIKQGTSGIPQRPQKQDANSQLSSHYVFSHVFEGALEELNCQWI